MKTDVIGPVQALREAWSLFRRYPRLLLEGSAIFTLLLILSVSIPVTYLNWALAATIMFPLFGGLHVMFLNAAKDSNPQITDLFSGFRHPGSWYVTGLVFVFIGALFLTIFALPLPTLVLILFSGPTDHGTIPALGPIGRPSICLVAAMLAFDFFIPYAFTWYTVADGTCPTQSLRASSQIVRSTSRRLLFTLISLGVMGPMGLLWLGSVIHEADANAFGPPGWLAFWTGTVFSLTVFIASTTCLYCHLTRSGMHDASAAEQAAS